MSVLKDMRCSACGAVRESFVDSNASESAEPCDVCQSLTLHRSECTGGLGKRYRFVDWGGYDIKDVEYLGGATATDEGTGEVRHGKHDAQWLGNKRDEIRSSQRRKRGAAPLFFHKR